MAALVATTLTTGDSVVSRTVSRPVRSIRACPDSSASDQRTPLSVVFAGEYSTPNRAVLPTPLTVSGPVTDRPVIGMSISPVISETFSA